MQVGTQAVTKLVDTFAHGAAGEPIAYVGSSGYIEIGVNKGSAARTLALGRGTPVILPQSKFRQNSRTAIFVGVKTFLGSGWRRLLPLVPITQCREQKDRRHAGQSANDKEMP